MNCTQAEILIQCGLDGRLSAAERTALDDHFAHCAACCAAWDEYRILARTAAAWTSQTIIPDDPGGAFTEAVMAQIAAGPSARWSRAVWQTVGIASAAVFVLTTLSIWAGPHLPPLAFSLSLTNIFPPRPPLFSAGPVQAVEHIPQDGVRLWGDWVRLWDALTIKSLVPSRWIWSALAAALGVNIFFILRARDQDRKTLLQ